jgi:phage-related protein
MKWEILYYSEAVQQDLLNLPPGIQSRYIHLTDRMELYGPNLGMPQTKAIDDGLFELRLKSSYTPLLRNRRKSLQESWK